MAANIVMSITIRFIHSFVVTVYTDAMQILEFVLKQLSCVPYIDGFITYRTKCLCYVYRDRAHRHGASSSRHRSDDIRHRNDDVRISSQREAYLRDSRGSREASPYSRQGRRRRSPSPVLIKRRRSQSPKDISNKADITRSSR